MKLVIGVSGSSGVELGVKFLGVAASLPALEIYIVFSKNAKEVLYLENGIDFSSLIASLDSNSICLNLDSNIGPYLECLHKNKNKIHIFEDSSFCAPIASGSFLFDCMIILPCSINTLSKISCGISDTLITRSALVALKEKRKLVLAVREMPLNSIMLSNMKLLSDLGVIIAPPILGYYSSISTLEDMENFLFGKWLDALGIENSIYKRWGENE